SVTKNHRLSFAPILVINLGPVLHLNRRHFRSSLSSNFLSQFPISNFRFPISNFNSPRSAGSSSPFRQSVQCVLGTPSSASISTVAISAEPPSHGTVAPSLPPPKCPAS